MSEDADDAETVMQAFERLCYEHLDTPDLSIQHNPDTTLAAVGGGHPVGTDAETRVQVEHYGTEDDHEAVIRQHGAARVSEWETVQRGIAAATGSLEYVRAVFYLTEPPHDEWSGTGGTAAAGASSAAGGAATECEPSGRSEPTAAGTDDERETGWLADAPDPSREVSQEPGGIRHVLAAPEPGEDAHVCGTAIDEAEYEGSMAGLYEDLLTAVADPMLCDRCEQALVRFYNIPQEKVIATREEQYGEG